MKEIINNPDLNIEEKIKQFHQALTSRPVDHFEVFSLSKTATLKEIELSYKLYNDVFSMERVRSVTDPGLTSMWQFIIKRMNDAFEVLSDYEKKAEYEKKGYREISLQDEKEDDPEDKAKEIYNKSKSLYLQKEFPIAADALKQAIKLSPKAQYYLLLGMCQTQIPIQKREAEQHLLKAAELEPWNAEHQAALGVLFYSERLKNRASVYFKKALELDSGHALSRKLLTEIEGPPRDNPLEQAKKQLKKLLPSVFDRKK